MTRPTLVTGAAGFAGGHLLELLASSGADLVAWHRPGSARPADLPAAWQGVDMLDREAVHAALTRLRPAAVYHFAGAAHVGHSWDHVESTFAINVRGTAHLVDGLRAIGADARVLIPSSAMIYATSNDPIREDHPTVPASPYGLSKLAQELAGDSSGPDVFIARAFNHFGPRQGAEFAASAFARSIADIEAGRQPPEISVGNLEAGRDLTDVRDTVRGYQLVLERGTPGRPYNICTGRAVVIRDLLDMLLKRARVPIQIKVDPARYRPNDQPIIIGDPQRIRSELGWVPGIPLEQTLDDLLAFWRRRE
jgi:GDP-4-dehydro-6-deoxy-D-mannose reductase